MSSTELVKAGDQHCIDNQRLHGQALDGLLRKHEDKLTGVLNGLDIGYWNPETDTQLPARYRMMVLLAIETGLRWGELIALRPCDIDMTTHIVLVHRTMGEVAKKNSPTGQRVYLKDHPKDDEQRSVQIDEGTCQQLQAHIRDNDVYVVYAVVPPQAARNPEFYHKKNIPVPTLRVVREDGPQDGDERGNRYGKVVEHRLGGKGRWVPGEALLLAAHLCKARPQPLFLALLCGNKIPE